MKSIARLSVDIDKATDRIIQKIIEAQRKTAELAHEDVINNFHSNTGEYVSSIKVSDTKVEKGKISTMVYTNLKSEDGYYIGRMIENGTGIYALEEHIGHTATFFASGYKFWYVPVKSVKRAIGEKIIINGKEFYVAKAQPAQPHFKPALEKNKIVYKKNIKKAIKEALK